MQLLFPSIQWFEDRGLVSQLPLDHRVLATWSRFALSRNISGTRVPGMWRVWIALGGLRDWARLPTSRLVLNNGTWMAIDLLDPSAMGALEVFRGDSAACRLFASLLGPGDTFLDVGANHGVFGLVASGLVGSRGRVIAFEPQPRLAGLIRQSFMANGMDAGDIFEVACSDVEGEAVLHVPHRRSGEASIFSGGSVSFHDRAYRVRTARLDALLADSHLPGRVFLKLDVEGSELRTLRGASTLIRERHPAILVEISPITATRSGDSVRAITQELIQSGYSSFSTPQRYPETFASTEIEYSRQHDLLALADPL